MLLYALEENGSCLIGDEDIHLLAYPWRALLHLHAAMVIDFVGFTWILVGAFNGG